MRFLFINKGIGVLKKLLKITAVSNSGLIYKKGNEISKNLKVFWKLVGSKLSKVPGEV